MPSLPLPRFLEDHRARIEQARRLEQIVRDSDANVREHRAQHTAVDGIALRGIPAIGRGVTGAIAGTRPG
jgi:hypothetical protein